MQATNSIFLGLLYNILFLALLWGTLFFILAPRFVALLPNHETLFTRLFIIIGFFPALDFAAATGWYSTIDITYRAYVGLGIYLVCLLWIKPLS
jgi:hypothetical protein